MYLDPGFGGMLIQIVVAIIAAGGAIAFSMRRKIRIMFVKDKKQDKQVNATSTNVKENDDDVVDMLSDDDDKKMTD